MQQQPFSKSDYIPEFFLLPETYRAHFAEKPILRTSLHGWLKTNNYVVEPKKNLPFTHTSFSGGLYDSSNLLQLKTKFGDDEIDSLSNEVKRALMACQESQILSIIGQAIYYSFNPPLDSSGTKRKLNRNNYAFIAEKKTPIFRLFIDLDLKSPVDTPDGLSSRTMLEKKKQRIDEKILAISQRNLENERIKLQTLRLKSENVSAFLQKLDKKKLDDIVHIIQSVIKIFYPMNNDEHDLDVVVCTTVPKVLKNNDGGDQHKDGLHLIWPNLYVDTEKALYIRESIIYKLENVLGKRTGLYNDWSDVVDEAVYGERSGGLRMVGCRKAERCKECSKQVKGKWVMKPGCPCDNGLFHTSRIYWPEFIFDKNGAETAQLKSKIQSMTNGNDKYDALMKFTCVRSFRKTPTQGYVVPSNAPVPVAQSQTTRKRTQNANPNARNVRRHREDSSSLSRMRGKVALDDGHPWISLFEAVIRTKFPKIYSSIIVNQVFMLPPDKNSPHPKFIISVEGEGSSYCQNLGDSHKSNKIWFFLTHEWIVQKCFCTCNVVRKANVTCKDYMSPKATLKNLPYFTAKIFPPIYHMTYHPSYEIFKGKNMSGMHVSFLPVLWNRISRASYGSDFDVSKGDVTIDENVKKELLDEINGTSRRSRALTEVEIEDLD